MTQIDRSEWLAGWPCGDAFTVPPRDAPAEVAIAALIRAAGIDLFIVPASLDGVRGMAWVGREGRRYITITSDWTGPKLAWLLAHELGHHALKHGTVWSSLPWWRNEWDADRWALDLLEKFLDPDVHWQIEQMCRERLRSAIQTYLDAGIWNHGEVEAGILAGCEVPDHLRRMLESWHDRAAPDGEGEYIRADLGSFYQEKDIDTLMAERERKNG